MPKAFIHRGLRAVSGSSGSRNAKRCVGVESIEMHFSCTPIKAKYRKSTPAL